MNRLFSKHVLITSFATALALGSLVGYSLQFSTESASSDHASASEPIQQPVPTDVTGTLLDQGQPRTYYLHTPPSYQPDRPMPLVLAFHGSGDQGKKMAEETGLNQLADREGFLIVYPDGINEKWNVSGKAQTGEDNVAFVHTLIARVKQLRTVDSQRIYATGLSNGGILVQKLACEAPSEIAAFATVAASLPIQFQTQCQKQTPVSMLMINGTADEVVPWQGGDDPEVRIGRALSIPSVPTVINFWQQHSGCVVPAKIGQIGDRVTTTTYTNCQAGTEVALMALNGAGHIWPGGAYGRSPWLDASQTIWDFFQRHTLTVAAQIQDQADKPPIPSLSR